jgi:transketolase
MRTAFIEALVARAATNKDIWLLNGDLGFSVLEAFGDKYPGRSINAGVAEQNMMGLAAGLAMTGKTVFCYSIANFPTLRCLEQIRKDLCYHNANVKVVAVGGGMAYGALGYTHFAIEDLSILGSLPNMVVLAPGDPFEVAAVLDAMLDHNGPCYLRLGKAGEPKVHKAPLPAYKLGAPIPLFEAGKTALFTTGGMLAIGAQLREKLSATHGEVALYSLPSLKPFPDEFIRQQAAMRENIFLLEEHSILGGLKDRVASAVLSMPSRKAAITSYALNEEQHHGVCGDQDYLRARFGLDAESLFRKISAQLSKAA